jgi:hypothetical protein
MLYVILVKSTYDCTKWNKEWPTDPKIEDRRDTKPVDKLVEQTIKAGDRNEIVRRQSLRFTDKKGKKKVKAVGPEEGGGEEAEVGGTGEGTGE